METATLLKPKKKDKKYKRVVLSRSAGGTVLIFAFLTLVGAFMVLPLVYVLVTAFKPLNEILTYPPKFFVQHPTLSNFRDLIEITQETWVPFERSLFNSLMLAILGTFAYIIIASLAAYPLAKNRSKWVYVYYQVVVLAILFRPEVTRTPLYIIISRLGLINTYWSLLLPVLAEVPLAIVPAMFRPAFSHFLGWTLTFIRALKRSI